MFSLKRPLFIGSPDRITGRDENTAHRKLEKRKRVPQKRLVDSLQNQVYNIFRHSRVLTDSVANNIFTIPMEDNYVIVLQPR